MLQPTIVQCTVCKKDKKLSDIVYIDNVPMKVSSSFTDSELARIIRVCADCFIEKLHESVEVDDVLSQ